MSGHGTFHWNELMTNDVDAAKAFYADTIGWTYDEFPMETGTYWVIMQDGKPVGGMMAWPDAAPDGEGPRWFAHLAVDDVDARVARCRGRRAARFCANRSTLPWSAGSPSWRMSPAHRWAGSRRLNNRNSSQGQVDPAAMFEQR